MNDLPRVLQNEIWEYVRGDRRFWKQKHQELVTDQMNIIVEESEHYYFVYKEQTKIQLMLELPRKERLAWARLVPAFIKHLHGLNGPIFATTRDEFYWKAREYRKFFFGDD